MAVLNSYLGEEIESQEGLKLGRYKLRVEAEAAVPWRTRNRKREKKVVTCKTKSQNTSLHRRLLRITTSTTHYLIDILLPLQLKVPMKRKPKESASAGSIHTKKKHALRNIVIQKLVAPEVTFKPTYIDRVCILEAVQFRQFDIEAYFIALVLTRVSIYGF